MPTFAVAFKKNGCDARRFWKKHPAGKKIDFQFNKQKKKGEKRV